MFRYLSIGSGMFLVAVMKRTTYLGVCEDLYVHCSAFLPSRPSSPAYCGRAIDFSTSRHGRQQG